MRLYLHIEPGYNMLNLRYTLKSRMMPVRYYVNGEILNVADFHIKFLTNSALRQGLSVLQSIDKLPEYQITNIMYFGSNPAISLVLEAYCRENTATFEHFGVETVKFQM